MRLMNLFYIISPQFVSNSVKLTQILYFTSLKASCILLVISWKVLNVNNVVRGGGYLASECTSIRVSYMSGHRYMYLFTFINQWK